MSQQAYADETVPPPRPVFFEFRCDGDHGLFGPPVATFEVSPPHPNGWTQAVAAGWLVTPERDLCPECRK